MTGRGTGARSTGETWGDLLAAFGLVAVCEVPLAVLYGFVFKTLWGWFIERQFHAPHLGIGPAIGLGLVLSYVQRTPKADKDDSALKAVDSSITSAVIKSATVLLFGAVLHAIIGG